MHLWSTENSLTRCTRVSIDMDYRTQEIRSSPLKLKWKNPSYFFQMSLKGGIEFSEYGNSPFFSCRFILFNRWIMDVSKERGPILVHTK